MLGPRRRLATTGQHTRLTVPALPTLGLLRSPPPGAVGGGGAAPRTPDYAYVMGSFAASEKDPDAWRRWLCWQGDFRPFRSVAAGVAPEILDASTDDVAELSADLDNARFSAADFDRILIGGIGPGWPGFGLSRPRARPTSSTPSWGRARGPTTPSLLALGATSAGGALTGSGIRGRRLTLRLLSTGMAPSARRMPPWACWPKSVKLPRPLPPAHPGRLHLPCPPLEGLVGPVKPPLLTPPHLGAALADRFRLPRTLVGPPPDRCRPVPTRVPLRGRRVGLLRELSGLQACRHRGWVRAAPPPPGVLRCGHRMERMDLCCQACADHIVSVAMGMGVTPPGRSLGVSVDPFGLIRRFAFGFTRGPT